MGCEYSTACGWCDLKKRGEGEELNLVQTSNFHNTNFSINSEMLPHKISANNKIPHQQRNDEFLLFSEENGISPIISASPEELKSNRKQKIQQFRLSKEAAKLSMTQNKDLIEGFSDFFSPSKRTKTHTTGEEDTMKLRTGKRYDKCVQDFRLILRNIKKLDFLNLQHTHASVSVPTHRSDRPQLSSHTLRPPFESLPRREFLSRKLHSLLSQWKRQIYYPTCRHSGEIRSYLSLSSDSSVLTLTHELNHFKNFPLLASFIKSNDLQFNQEVFLNMQSDITKQCSLTIFLSLSISLIYQQDSQSEEEAEEGGVSCVECNRLERISDLESEIWVRGEQPLKDHVVESFLYNSEERERILKWVRNNGAIPVEIGYNLTSLEDEKACGFYIFDGKSQEENLQRGFSIFDIIEREDNEKLFYFLKNANGNELKAIVQMQKSGIICIELILYRLHELLESDICNQLGTYFNEEKWNQFKKLFQCTPTDPLGTSHCKKHSLLYSSNGYVLNITAEIGLDMDQTVHIQNVAFNPLNNESSLEEHAEETF